MKSDEYRQQSEANSALNQREILAGKVRLESVPRYLNIDIIGVCNVQPPCRMCNIGETDYMLHRGLDVEELVGMGDFLDKSEHVTNCGIGEPLLHPRFLDIVRVCHDRGKTIGVNSNGLVLNRKTVEALAPYMDTLEVFFSLDAATEETFRKIRGNGFQTILDNIAHYCRQRKELGRKFRTRVGVCLIPMRANRHEIADFVQLGKRVGADVVAVRSLNKRHENKIIDREGFVFDYNEQVLSAEELEECRKQGESAGRRRGIVFECQYDVNEDDEKMYAFFKPKELVHHKAPCLMPWYFILPFQNGDTTPCCYVSESLGNWREEGLTKLWNSPLVVEMREKLLAGEMPDVCLRHRSCPVVRSHLKEDRGRKLVRYAEEALVSADEYTFRVEDSSFEFLVEFGAFNPERLAEGGSFRWLSGHARFDLPNLLGRLSGEVVLRIRCVKPGVGAVPLRVSASAAGSPEITIQIDHDDWFELVLPINGVRGGSIAVDLSCENPWRPSELWETKDERLLSVLLREIRLRRHQAPKSKLWRWFAGDGPQAAVGSASSFSSRKEA